MVSSTTPIRRCPFCGSPGQLVGASGSGFGICCGQCGVFFPAIHTQVVAITLWNKRRGTASAAGGRATLGVSTAKKRRAARTNLRLARNALKLKRLRAKVELLMPQLRAAREAQIYQAEQAAAASRTKVKMLIDRYGLTLASKVDRNASGDLKAGQASTPVPG